MINSLINIIIVVRIIIIVVTAKFVPLFIFEGFPHGWAESAASIIPHGGVWFGGKSLTLIWAF